MKKSEWKEWAELPATKEFASKAKSNIDRAKDLLVESVKGMSTKDLAVPIAKLGGYLAGTEETLAFLDDASDGRIGDE